MAVGRPERGQQSCAFHGAVTRSPSKHGHAYHDGAATNSQVKSLSLATMQVNAPHKGLTVVKIDTNLVYYIDEQAQSVRANLLTHKTCRPPSSQSILSFANVKRIILETQSKPLTSNRR